MAMVFAAAVPLLHSETMALDTARPMILKAQEARYALAHVAAALRQARAVTQVTDGGGPAASMTFLAGDGTPTTFQRDAASDEVRYGPAGSEAVLAKNCTGLAITCFAADRQALPSAPMSLAKTAGVSVAMTVVDPHGKSGPTTLTTLAARSGGHFPPITQPWPAHAAPPTPKTSTFCGRVQQNKIRRSGFGPAALPRPSGAVGGACSRGGSPHPPRSRSDCGSSRWVRGPTAPKRWCE